MYLHKKLTQKHKILLLFAIFSLLYYFGAFTHIWEQDFNTQFRYPYDGDISESVQLLRHNQTPPIRPINAYHFKYSHSCPQKCNSIESLRLVYIVKSSPQHFHQRAVIRKTWGYEKRFSDVEIRTVFLIGAVQNLHLVKMINDEFHRHNDLVQGNFTDSYYNNTLKTMMGMHWATKHCPRARYYMFVDDDYYISTKNVLRFIRNPTNYPQYLQTKTGRNLKQYDIDLDESNRLFAGYAFKSAPHRHMSSKWYVSLNEYPYDMWPIYVTAGAYILSRETLFDFYFASYYTQHFRFDDIYLGLLAYKTKIEPFHSDHFHFYKLNYNPKLYQYVIASHGFDDMEELLKVWTEQKSLGNA